MKLPNMNLPAPMRAVMGTALEHLFEAAIQPEKWVAMGCTRGFWGWGGAQPGWVTE